MNLQQSEKTIETIRQWYVKQIHAAAKDHGGMERLSASLGYDSLYLYKLLHRNSFSALRRVVKKIHGIQE
jgi:hypothetical protein